jgi:hypothetical protein
MAGRELRVAEGLSDFSVIFRDLGIERLVLELDQHRLARANS